MKQSIKIRMVHFMCPASITRRTTWYSEFQKDKYGNWTTGKNFEPHCLMCGNLGRIYDLYLRPKKITIVEMLDVMSKIGLKDAGNFAESTLFKSIFGLMINHIDRTATISDKLPVVKSTNKEGPWMAYSNDTNKSPKMRIDPEVPDLKEVIQEVVDRPGWTAHEIKSSL